jgi:hypothetical protein
MIDEYKLSAELGNKIIHVMQNFLKENLKESKDFVRDAIMITILGLAFAEVVIVNQFSKENVPKEFKIEYLRKFYKAAVELLDKIKEEKHH